MPLKTKKSKKMFRRKRNYRRKARVPRGLGMSAIVERASASYSTLSVPLVPNSNVYSFSNFALSAASTRVLGVAKAYQFYRIKRVTWEVRPAYDTFVALPSTSTTSVPHLYWRIDTDGVFPPSTSLQTLKASGCRPIRLDDKVIRKMWRPAVLQGVASEAGSAANTPSLVLGSKRISPWLPTNANAYVAVTQNQPWSPSSIDHLGLLLSVDQDTGVNSNSPVAYVSFTIDFEFSKPLDTLSTGNGITSIDTATIAPQYVPPPAESQMIS